MAKVLYISYDGMTDPLGQSQVLPYLNGLVAKGHEIHLVSAEKPENYTENKAKIAQKMEEAGISWYPLSYTKRPPVLSTIKDLRKIKQLARRIVKKEQINIVHCRSYIAAMAGVHLKKKFGTRFIFDMRGFWADERLDGRIWSLDNPIYSRIYKYFKNREEEFLNNADYTISLTSAGKKEIQSWPQINNQPIPIEVIPCCADLDLFNYNITDDERVGALKKQWRITDTDKVLIYVGSIGTWYMLDEMLDFYAVLQKKNPTWKLLFLTGEDPEVITGKAAQKNIDVSKIIITRSPREQVPDYLALAEAGLFFILPVFSKKASSPTKQGEMMGMGLPVVCNDNVGDTGEIIKSTDSGLVIDQFDNETYEQLADQLDRMEKPDKAKIREAAKKYYDLENGIEKYHGIYLQLEKKA